MPQQSVHTHKLLNSIRAVLLGCSVLLSPLASSQKLEEIIVTAQKRAESLQDVSVSVTALSAEKLSDFGIARLEEITAYVPNFVMSETGIGTTIYIRGVGSGINQGFEQSVGMYRDGIYYGRAQLARAPIFDMERVEVLRGPQVTLFGNNSIGGAVTMAAAKPTDEFEGFIAGLIDFDDEFIAGGEHNNHGEKEITAVISGPINNSLAARLSVRKYEMGGYLYNATTNRDEPKRDYLTTRLHFTFMPESIDFFDSRLLLERSTFDVQGRQIIIPQDLPSKSTVGVTNYISNYGLDPNKNYGALNSVTGETLGAIYQNFPSSQGLPMLDSTRTDLRYSNDDYSINETNSAALTLNFSVGNFEIKSITGYLDYTYDDACDCDFTGATLIKYESDEDYEQTSQEIRITSGGGDFIDIIAGVYYQKDELLFNDALVTEENSALGDLLNTIQNDEQLTNNLSQIAGPRSFEQDSELYSAFGQLTINLRDDFRVMAGMRRSKTEKSAQRELTITKSDRVSSLESEVDQTYSSGLPGEDYGFDGIIDFNDHENFFRKTRTTLSTALNVLPHRQEGSREKMQTSYSLILEWDINEDLMSYLSRTRGYKSGGYDVRSNNPTEKKHAIDNLRNYISNTSLVPGTYVPGTFEFDDEESLAHEIGIKASIGDAAEVNIAYFYNNIKNLQVSVFDGGVGFNVSNAASAITQGVEIDGRIALSDKILLSGSIAWLDFEFEDYQDGVCVAEDRRTLAANQLGATTSSVEPGADGLFGNVGQDGIEAYDTNDNGVIDGGFFDPPPTEFSTRFEATQDNVTITEVVDGNCRLVQEPGLGKQYLADMTGKTNQYVSSYSGALSLMYEDDQLFDDHLFSAAFDMNFTGSYHPTQNLDESFKQDSYKIYNMRLSLSSFNERYSISLIGRNIFDTKVISYAGDVPLATPQFGTITKYGFLQRTKSWALQGRYNF